ncbi:hypothetical protein CCHR01_16838 [Colletotrichum chrysophilum]|uniref:Uncharacterized protein n=1 Tax=Colletotrichum chrysophilum TaxID=1836956 RepID=A0AAD9EA37_9PEZI|nr:hypothetical protein CCHR01_16838 [Colletotrichum chrysophilum]
MMSIRSACFFGRFRKALMRRHTNWQ